MQAGGQHLGGFYSPPGAVIAEPGDTTGLIMVVQIEAVPGPAFQFRLPFVEDRTQIFQGRFDRRPFTEGDIGPGDGPHMLKMEDHAQFCLVLIGVFHGFLNRDAGGFPDSQQIITGQDFTVHFPQKFVDPGTADRIWRRVPVKTVIADSVRESLDLGNQADNIHPETIDPFVAPPGHQVEDFLPDFVILPVQVRLFAGEQMQIVLSGLLIKLPGGTAETGGPVVGGAAIRPGIPPDIIVSVRIVPG